MITVMRTQYAVIARDTALNSGTVRATRVAELVVCGQVIEEVIHEQDEEEQVVQKPCAVEQVRYEPEFALPQQTYHHMIGRSFGVAFNDRSFLSPEVTTSGADRYYYGSFGTFCNRQLHGDRYL